MQSNCIIAAIPVGVKTGTPEIDDYLRAMHPEVTGNASPTEAGAGASA
jgi:hypothetical protein